MIKPRVLFLCTGNSRRTQMAEGFLRTIAGDRCGVMSAGNEQRCGECATTFNSAWPAFVEEHA